MSATCVFCGRPIADGEPAVARPPMAAHAACADAALADDRHWDAIAEREPVSDESGPDSAQPARRAVGCVVLVMSVAAAATVRLLRSAR